MKPTKLIRDHGCAAFLALLVAGAGYAAEAPAEAPPSASKDAEAPATHTVKRAAPKAKARFDAVFEPVAMTPVKIEPKVWADLTVLDAVRHGQAVKKGDWLVKLDTEKLREQIDDLEQERPGAKVALELATAELDNLVQTTPLKLEAAKRTHRIANEDLAYFDNTGRAQREKAAQFNFKGAEQRLDGAREELRQLEKMYKADDLTEETEEIILRRQRFAVESAEYGLEATKLSTDLSLKTSIPREAETLKNGRRDQELALALSEETLSRNLAKKRLDLEKQKRDQKKAEKKLADLKADLERLTVCSPMDGLVYYGACEAGKWTTGGTVAKKLVPTGKLAPNEVFMTVVDPARLVLRAVVQEGDLAQLRSGMEGKASPVSAPERKLTVKLDELGAVPLPTGGFEARLSVELDSKLGLVPGMNCKVAIGESQKPGPLQAPKEAVFSEDGQSRVFVIKSDGSHARCAVKTGESDGGMVEILEGLSEGDKILLSKPK